MNGLDLCYGRLRFRHPTFTPQIESTHHPQVVRDLWFVTGSIFVLLLVIWALSVARTPFASCPRETEADTPCKGKDVEALSVLTIFSFTRAKTGVTGLGAFALAAIQRVAGR